MSGKSGNTGAKPLLRQGPEGKYNLTLRHAKKRLKEMDVADICQRSKASYSRKEGFSLPYLNYALRIAPQNFAVYSTDPKKSIDPAFEVLILHYLRDARTIRPTGRWVSYRELPSGGFYYPVFRARAESPLIKRLGSQPQLFKKAAGSLGGEPAPYGDLAFKIITFPRLPLVYILWTESEEFPANASILFDSSAEDHLHIEDLACLGETVTRELIRSAQQI
ncbi:MAG: DUF3786 domain-containing protein [bacterium]